MNKGAIRRVAAMVEAVGALAGVPVLWRYPPRPRSVPERMYHHCNRYCMAVKSGRSRRALCNNAESTRLAEHAVDHRDGFLKKCHAGVLEWVVPMYGLDSGRYAGALICGPYRDPGARCPYTRLAASYRGLPAYEAKTVRALGAILSGIAEHIMLLRKQARPLPSRAVPGDKRIVAAQAFMRERLGEPLRLDEVAARSSLSPSRFVHLFTHECGVSYSACLTRMRIEESQALLTTTDRPLSQIAAEVGFCDQSYFGSVFKRLVGATPKAFRLRQRKRHQA